MGLPNSAFMLLPLGMGAVNKISERDMVEKATRQQIKNHNTRLVLKTIYGANSRISRADIARATSLTRPTVSSIVSKLIDLKLVTETGYGPSVGGKPPLMLEIDVN